MFDFIIGKISKDIAIDLGTANTIISIKGKGIVLNEPSFVALRRDCRGVEHIVAVGHKAKEMEHKTPPNIQVIRPMKKGVISNVEVIKKMLRFFIEKIHNRKILIKPRVVVCVPYGITNYEKNVLKQSIFDVGARDVFLIEEPIAAALGAGLPIENTEGRIVVDIGGGTTEIGILSFGGLVSSKSVKIAGDTLDEAIVEYVKNRYNLIISEKSAEDVKIRVASISNIKELNNLRVTGKSYSTDLFLDRKLTQVDIQEAIQKPIKEITKEIKTLIANMPISLAGDIVKNGIMLTGGGALIRGLKKYLTKSLRIPIHIADEPLLSVAKGTALALENINNEKNPDLESFYFIKDKVF